MKHVIPIIFLLFCACKDADYLPFDPHDARQIEGMWRSGQHPTWTYWFDSVSDRQSGYLVQSIFDLNTQLVEQHYAYKIRNDSVIEMLNLINENPRIVTAYFETDSTATLTETVNGLILRTKIKRF